MNLHPNNMIEPFWYFHQMKRQLSWIHSKINEKQQFAEYKERHWADEALTEVSGMDCDGVQYSGQIMSCKPDYYEWQKKIDEAYDWADGPMHFRLVSDSEAAKIRPASRDRGMEAFEDGHPYTIYY